MTTTTRASLLLACRMEQHRAGYVWPWLTLDPGADVIDAFIEHRQLRDKPMNDSGLTYGEAFKAAYAAPLPEEMSRDTGGPTR